MVKQDLQDQQDLRDLVEIGKTPLKYDSHHDANFIVTDDNMVTTTCGAASGNKAGIMKTLGLQ